MSFTDKVLRFFLFKKFTLIQPFGVNFTFHSSLLVAGGLLPLTYFAENPVTILYIFTCHILMLVSHELGHAVFSKLNKLSVYEVQIGIIHGLCKHEHPNFGQEQKNVNIAWGGVAFQIILALFAVVLFATNLDAEYKFLSVFSWFMLTVNLKIALLNLLPFWELDGVEAWKILEFKNKKPKQKKRHLESVK